MQSKLVLACAQCGSRNYSTVKGKAQNGERLEIKKFCKVCNAHTVHRETK
ncbi:50S ribosomal protein L33 [Bacillus haimaensis]